jgi:RecB family endonuclease NucS
LSDNSEIKYNKEIKKFEITDTDGYVKTYSEKELKTLIKESPELFETIVNKIKIDKAKGKLDKKLKNEKLYKEVAF